MLKWYQGKKKDYISEEINNNNLPIDSVPLTNISYETHPKAIYTSKLLDFNSLPEPKNSHDYYEQKDNIISMKYSGIY